MRVYGWTRDTSRFVPRVAHVQLMSASAGYVAVRFESDDGKHLVITMPVLEADVFVRRMVASVSRARMIATAEAEDGLDVDVRKREA